jgi:hypothetical protein
VSSRNLKNEEAKTRKWVVKASKRRRRRKVKVKDKFSLCRPEQALGDPVG